METVNMEEKMDTLEGGIMVEAVVDVKEMAKEGVMLAEVAMGRGIQLKPRPLALGIQPHWLRWACRKRRAPAAPVVPPPAPHPGRRAVAVYCPWAACARTELPVALA